MAKDVIRGFDDCFAGRADERVAASTTFHRMMSFSLDIILAQTRAARKQ